MLGLAAGGGGTGESPVKLPIAVAKAERRARQIKEKSLQKEGTKEKSILKIALKNALGPCFISMLSLSKTLPFSISENKKKIKTKK